MGRRAERASPLRFGCVSCVGDLEGKRDASLPLPVENWESFR